jgi:hypothetical protein
MYNKIRLNLCLWGSHLSLIIKVPIKFIHVLINNIRSISNFLFMRISIPISEIPGLFSIQVHMINTHS